MLCDSVSHNCLALSIHRGAKTDEDRAEIWRFGLAYTAVTKLLKMGKYLSKGYHIFMNNFLTTVPSATTLYKMGTFITRTIHRNRKYIPQAFSNRFQTGETNISEKVHYVH
jgi:hypothetical protein